MPALPEGVLGPVSEFAATVFRTADEALDAVLTLAQDILHMGTVFVAEADRRAGQLTVVAVREGLAGCGLSAGIVVPLHETV
jgi:hypothetical protein